MRKIATPQDLQAELRQLLAYTQGSDKPSRAKIASALRGLAERLGYNFDPAYRTHPDWARDIGDIYRHIKKARDGLMELESGVGGLQREEDNVSRDQPMLAKHLKECWLVLNGGVIKGQQAIRELEQSFKKFHGSDERSASDRTAAGNPYKALAAKARAMAEACQEVAEAADKAASDDRGAVAQVDNMARKAGMYEAKGRLFIKALKAAEGA